MTETPETPDTEQELPEGPEAEASPANDREPELETEVARLKDQLLRALAEQENVRRRAQRERDDAVKYAAQKFATDLLSVADNLRRALDSAPPAQGQDDATKSLLVGVAATERELLGAFEKHGIRRVDPMGEKFDHNLHQAMFELEATGKPAGTIVQVLAPGYVLQDRLLRAAMVGVAKGNAPAPVPEPGAEKDKPEGYQRVDTKV